MTATASASTVLDAATWTARAAAHAERADAATAGHRARRSRHEKHVVEDFLFEYYPASPAQLRRWHPGAGVALAPGPDGPAPHAAWRWYRTDGDGTVRLDVDAFLAARGDAVRFVVELLAATASRPAATGCFGLHEWAMVYREPAGDHRHALPLRLGEAGTDAVVESHRIRCTHVDAFRFFTPEAVGRNTLTPTRATQAAMEQPGCLHANMDLYKWALKLGPLVPGGLLLDCFDLAREIRTTDMQASPYDVTSYGLEPVAIETAEGKAEYVRRQRDTAARSNALRSRLVAVGDAVLPPAAGG
ncbi:3-methyladenine DNA glycosylase [Cellulomonas wangsupingiae]|uniref:3-methyladenine DNA glycosylase n=1 Tax=Cellulomonas wangsupingiae TaxID=2968085 RepID=A0ABY5K7F7_9CELL|nr:3-methyladenine DNA glycosylase [Cellulomonas wangsupingiae]MCC2334770.1 3-methyladenine DNA glycosylase [Cellulomonas wangsupingiae]UUI66275.1 3-methyladenine DNA glycosylase [Cellulomonas wangsupingiae]